METAMETVKKMETRWIYTIKKGGVLWHLYHEKDAIGFDLYLSTLGPQSRSVLNLYCVTTEELRYKGVEVKSDGKSVP